VKAFIQFVLIGIELEHTYIKIVRDVTKNYLVVGVSVIYAIPIIHFQELGSTDGDAEITVTYDDRLWVEEL
jgi:hypothetical protein